MRLRGVLDFSLGNFLCLRGYAQMGVLEDCSEPDASYQRDLLPDQEQRLIRFLSQGEYLFFPEVILCATLSEDDAATAELFRFVQTGDKFNLRFNDFALSCTVDKRQSDDDSRSVEFFRSGLLQIKGEQGRKFSRIDGNHRLSVASAKGDDFRKYNAPYCMVFFRNADEAKRFSRVLFHNINYKQVPLTMEQNLRLILDDEEVFPDDKLKTEMSFGWAYYLARKMHDNLDFDLMPHLEPFLKDAPRTFLVEQLTFLLENKIIKENENAIRQVKRALGQVNALLEEYSALKGSTNRGLLAALVYFKLEDKIPIASFVRWVLHNHLHQIGELNSADLIKIFDSIQRRRKRTIFVSMKYGPEKTEEHYKAIENVCQRISDELCPDMPLTVQRVDHYYDGTSYYIADQMLGLTRLLRIVVSRRL